MRGGGAGGAAERGGGIALCAVIAPYADTRRALRGTVEAAGGFVEVYVSTPLAACVARDPRGMYARVRLGLVERFTGIGGGGAPRPVRGGVPGRGRGGERAARRGGLWLARAARNDVRAPARMAVRSSLGSAGPPETARRRGAAGAGTARFISNLDQNTLY